MDLAQAYFLLQSLKDNIPHHSEIDQKWVKDYHDILDAIETNTGFDLKAFRVPDTEVHHPVIGARRGSFRGGLGQVTYGKNLTVPHARLMMKIEAVLSYFRYQQSGEPAPKQAIGFKAP